MELLVRSSQDFSQPASNSLVVYEKIWGRPYNESLIHQVVTSFLSAARAGTKAQKSRGEVRGGGIKPWRQKGTGRARAGTITSPIWRKGGVTFAAKPRDYSQKVNKKMYRGAIASILSELVRQDRLHVVEDFSLDSHKTKDLLTKFSLYKEKKVLIVSNEIDENLYLATRNLYKFQLSDVVGLDPVSLVDNEIVIFTISAVKEVEEWLE